MIAAAYAWLHSRLARCPDSEHEQAFVRLIIAVLILGYLWLLQHFGQQDSAVMMMLVMLAETTVALTLLLSILTSPGTSHLRRWIGMLADYATLATLMSINAPALAPLYVLVLWVTIGNGLRYGTVYLWSAAALSSTAFLTVILNNDFWKEQPYLSGGLWAGLIAIPAYLSSLLKSLQRVTEEARRANAAKSQFLATMSHEFRSPLNGIIGMAELMQGTRLVPEQKEYADVILTSAQTLLLLVDDVLDISAIEAGKLQRKDADFDLHELIQRLNKMLQPPAALKGLKLKSEIDPEVPLQLHGDGSHLTQILLNLLHNAVKFTEQGTVALSVSKIADAGEGLRLRFSVRDTGIGIPEEDKERIFQAFEQLDAGPTRRYGGTGLGTTIAKTLTQLLDGRIGLEDNPGGGSHFWVELPMRVQDASAARDADHNVVSFDDPFIRHKARVRPLRVLIADDQHANRTVLLRILERAGHRVTSVNDGEQALDVLEGGNIDLAIVDMHMPQMSGLDVIRQLRMMQAGGKRTPMIVLSADATEQAARDSKEAGAQAFLTKPVIIVRLLETIADVLSPQKLPAVRPVGEAGRSVTNPVVLEELAAMGLGDAFLKEFVDQCLKDAAGCLAELGKSASSRSWADFRDAAHAFKGVAGNLGAQLVTERCQQIMRASDEVLAGEHRKFISELTTQLTAVSQQSRNEVSRIIALHQRDDNRAPGTDVS